MVGEIDSLTTPPNYRLFTHKKLEIGYNGKQVGDSLFPVDLIIVFAWFFHLIDFPIPVLSNSILINLNCYRVAVLFANNPTFFKDCGY